MAFGEFMKKLTNPSLQIKPPSQEKMEMLTHVNIKPEGLIPQRVQAGQSLSSNGLPENLQKLRDELKSRPRPVPDSKKLWK